MKHTAQVSPELQAKIDALLLEIAQEHLSSQIDTLGSRGRDALDFHDVSVTGIKRALAEAYLAGMRTAVTSPALAKRQLPEVEGYRAQANTNKR